MAQRNVRLQGYQLGRHGRVWGEGSWEGPEGRNGGGKQYNSFSIKNMFKKEKRKTAVLDGNRQSLISSLIE